jgi:hypothetical protein
LLAAAGNIKPSHLIDDRLAGYGAADEDETLVRLEGGARPDGSSRPSGPEARPSGPEARPSGLVRLAVTD